MISRRLEEKKFENVLNLFMEKCRWDPWAFFFFQNVHAFHTIYYRLAGEKIFGKNFDFIFKKYQWGLKYPKACYNFFFIKYCVFLRVSDNFPSISENDKSKKKISSETYISEVLAQSDH